MNDSCRLAEVVGRLAGRTSQASAKATPALQHAHDMDVIHRDIKPANILIDIRGNLRVTDFGLARLHNDKELTVSGDVLGTFRYMSPEQALGRHGVVDHRTDIYSLGATLYELLAYRPASDGEDRAELRQQVASRDPIPPRRLNRAVPIDLETIVLKALEKEPKDRYATAGEMSEDFRRFLGNRPIQARRPSLVERTRKWSRRHRTLVTSSVVVLLLAVIGLTISSVIITQERSKTRTAYQQLAIKQGATEFALAREEKQRALADASLRQAREMLDFATLRLAHATATSTSWLFRPVNRRSAVEAG